MTASESVRSRLRAAVRRHPIATSVLLSGVSLALVFGAVLGTLPVAALPRIDPLLAAIPHLNAAISAVAIAAIALGWRWIRRGQVARHRAAMGTAFVLFLTFLALYLYRVALVGPTAFDGDGLRRTIYLTVLAVHVVLAIVTLPLLYYVLVLGLTRPVPAIRESLHPRIGRIAAALWMIAFALGTVVYGMLYGI